jgi:hypothetical protein
MSVNRQNYLLEAGYDGEPDPESESMLRVELQKKATKRAGRFPLKGL